MKSHSVFFCAVLLTVGALIDAGATEPSEQTEVAETMRAMFAAAAADDATTFRAVTTPDFYSFDAGERFTRDALLALIKEARASGKTYVWNVTDPEVYIQGNLAWITYVNRGSVTDASGTKNVTWLESAVLQRENGTWRVRFFHSTRAAEKKAAGG